MTRLRQSNVKCIFVKDVMSVSMHHFSKFVMNGYDPGVLKGGEIVEGKSVEIYEGFYLA